MTRQRGRRVRATWTVALLTVTVAPIGLLVDVPATGGAIGVMVDATGIAATSTLLGALVLSARLRSLTTTMGLEHVGCSHRYLGSLGAVETAAHIGLAVASRAGGMALLNPLTATDAAVAAEVATAGLLVLTASSPLRRRGHETWRRVHLAATVAVLAGVALHILWLDHLIRDGMLGAWFGGAAVALALVLGYRWLWRPARGSSAYTVRDVRHDADTVSTLVLSPRRGRHREGPRTLEFAPGQFAWLRLSRLGGEEHPYSMSGSARGADTLEFTVRHTGDFTDRLANLQPGRTVYLDGPHGAFTPSADAPGLVMIASGVGMTPILSILRTLADEQDRRSHRLIVAAGRPDQLLFSQEIEALRARIQLEVVTTVRASAPDWQGRTGLVDGPLLSAFLPGRPVRDRLLYFVCGPPLLVADALSALHILRVPQSQIRTERFDPNTRPGGRREQHSRTGPTHRTAGGSGSDTGGDPGGALRVGDAASADVDDAGNERADVGGDEAP